MLRPYTGALLHSRRMDVSTSKPGPRCEGAARVRSSSGGAQASTRRTLPSCRLLSAQGVPTRDRRAPTWRAVRGHRALTVDLQGAADLLKVHPHTVRDLIRAGALPAGRVGRAYVLSTKGVMAHIQRVITEQTAARSRRGRLRDRGTCA